MLARILPSSNRPPDRPREGGTERPEQSTGTKIWNKVMVKEKEKKEIENVNRTGKRRKKSARRKKR